MARTIKQIEFPVPEQPKAIRAAAYARVSSDKDAMLHSLSAQVSYYSKLIQGHREGFIAVCSLMRGFLARTPNAAMDLTR